MKKTKNFIFTAIGSIVVYEVLKETGALDKLKGTLKNKLGTLFQDPGLQFEGKMDIGKGIVKDVSHDIKNELSDLLED